MIKGYHAEEREDGVFAGGVDRLLQNVMKSLTMTSVLSRHRRQCWGWCRQL